MKAISAFLFAVTLATMASRLGYARETVQSHAYVFASDDDVQPLALYVIVEQPGTVRFLTCWMNGVAAVPQSASELTKLLESQHCYSDLNPKPVSGLLTQVQIFHQKAGDRYVKVETGLIGAAAFPGEQGGSDILASSTSVIIDPNANDTLGFFYVFHDIEAGFNPKVSTMRVTKFRKFDAVIDYPVISEKPIEQ